VHPTPIAPVTITIQAALTNRMRDLLMTLLATGAKAYLEPTRGGVQREVVSLV
jgi:hypothetical protein